MMGGKNLNGGSYLLALRHQWKKYVFTYFRAESNDIPRAYSHVTGELEFTLHCLRNFDAEATVEYERQLTDGDQAFMSKAA